MPALGFGTWPLKGAQCRDVVLSAIDVGYRHIDTAQGYGNEIEVGQAVQASGARGDLFITTKLWQDRLVPALVSSAVDESLDRLQTSFIDLLLIHWPNPAVPLTETLAAMDAVRRSGRVKHVGLSNFTIALLAEACATGIPLFCNQVEFHPFLDQSKVLAATRAAGLLLIGYSPLARGKGGAPQILDTIALRHGKSASQVILRWALQRDGVGLIVKSSTRARQAENFAVFDFALDEAEMGAITGLANGTRVVDLAIAPAWD